MKTPWTNSILRVAVATFLAVIGASVPSAQAAFFYDISSITSSTAASDLWPVSNLIQGPGTGFDEFEPHDKTSTDAAGNWVTADPGGFPSDYIEVAGAPVLVLDLGSDVALGEISVWGYSDGNSNGASAFSLRFATEADGPGGFGASIAYNPAFSDVLNVPSAIRQSFEFSETVNARYVEMTITDNHFGGALPGGDRVGLGEIAFEIVTGGNEPSIVVPGSVQLALNGTVQDFDIPVLNTGIEDLQISGATFSGPDAAAFSLVSFPPFVESLETENIVIRFDPTGRGEEDVSAVLEIASNDPDKPTTQVQLNGAFPQFYEIANVSTLASEFYPALNLIQGAGIGFDENPPHDSLGAGPGGAWVTEACGFPCDYYDSFDPPVIVVDLGADVLMTEISVWGYASTNANGVKDFSLRFATDAEGEAGFGTSITYNPEFNDVDINQTPRQSFVFSQPVTARYVEFTCVDNHFVAPGDGSTPGSLAGGDRVGLSEIAFEKARVAGTPTVEAPLSADLALDGTMQEFEIPIRNIGAPALTISNARFTGTNAGAFSIVAAPASIDTYFVDSITIGFNPAGLAGPISASLLFDSNDPNQPVTTIQLAGILHDPQVIAEALNRFDFSEGAGPQALMIPLSNAGATQPLNVSEVVVGGASAANFQVTGVSSPIAPNTAGAINLTFDPQGGSGAFPADLTITTDDPVTPTIIISVVVQVVPANPLVALWTLDTDASDASGNGHDGDPTVAIIYGDPGANPRTGGSASFDGSEGIHVPFDEDLNPDSFTLTAWVRPDDTANWNSVVTSREDNGTSVNGYILYNTPEGTWDFWTGAGGPPGAWQRNIGPLAEVGEWQHLAISFDRATSTKILYVNGENVAEIVQGYSPNGTSPDTSRPLNIGSGQDFGDGFFFLGNIDDVALFSIALPQEEVMRIMDQGASVYLNLAPFQVTDVFRSQDGSVTITFNSAPGRIYLVERSLDLMSWEEIDDSVISEGESTEYTDGFPPAGAANLYYRVLEP